MTSRSSIPSAEPDTWSARTVLKLFRTTAFRLSLIYAGLFSIAAALSFGYVYWHTNVLFARQINETIQAEVQGLGEQFRTGGLETLIQVIKARTNAPGASIYVIAESDGTPLAGNVSTIPAELLNSRGRVPFHYRRPSPDEMKPRLGVAQVIQLPDGKILVVGRDIEDSRHLTRIVANAFVWGVGLVALAGVLGGVLLARIVLRRIDAVTSTSRTIIGGDLSQRIPLAGTGDELDRLAGNLNTMLERIEQLMTGMREVSDNIAHDLKTPLTRIRNRLDTALRESTDTKAYRDVLEQTIEDADELIRTFNALLSIARLEAGAHTEDFDDFDLGVAVRDIADLYEPLAEARGVRIEVSSEDPLSMHANRQLIAQALANLIDNAIRYGAPSCPQFSPVVSISARRVNGLAEITVADHGPGIPAHLRGAALERFTRLETSRSNPGSGLGLSLVSAVTRLHGGEIELSDNDPGLRVALRMPLPQSRNHEAAEI
jgi:signal transduction histidine kinase